MVEGLAPPPIGSVAPNADGKQLSRLSRFVSPVRQRWPSRLWLVRHGQSAGNVAREAAVAAGEHLIGLEVRDVDVPLSDLGHPG
jgi:hypothetical protein